MINTKKIFDKTIQEIAKVVKLINEDGEDVDSKIISDMNDDISDLHATLFDGSNDFVELKDLKNYIKDIVGKDYFSDRRCWEYLYDSVYEVFIDIPNEFDESMQTGLGMMQQLPTNSVYDGELDDLYNSDDEERKKKMNKRLEEKKIDEEDRIEALAQFLGLDEEEKEDIKSTYDDKNFEVNGEEYLVVTEDEGYEMAKEDVRSLLEDDLGLEGVSKDTQEYAIEKFCTYDWESDLHSFNKGYCDDIKSEYDNKYGSRLVQECDDRVGLDDEDGGYVLTFEDGNGDTMYVYDKKSYGDDVDKAERFLTEANAFDFDTNDIEDKLTEEFGEDFEFDCSAEFEEDLVDFDDLSEKLTEELDKDYNSMAEWFDSIYGSSWVSEMKDTLKDYIDWEALAEYVIDVDGVANTLARYDGRSHEEKVNGEWFYIYRTN